MGLADWFNAFCSNIQVADGGTISSRYKDVTRRLNADFWSTTSDTAHSLYVGSYGRNTAVRVVVLDNLREGVVTPDTYDPAINPLYLDVLAHYGAVAPAYRVRNPSSFTNALRRSGCASKSISGIDARTSAPYACSAT